MISIELRFLQIRQDINVIAIPKSMINTNTDENYYFDFLLFMPYVSEYSVINSDNKSYYNIVALKINPVINKKDTDYITLERTNNCMKYQIKNMQYEKESLLTVNGIKADNIKIKIYSHDDHEVPLCNWVQSEKEP